MPTMRAMHLDKRTTLWDDGRQATTPPDGVTDLAVFLGRIAQVAHPNGLTVLLAADAVTTLGLPQRAPTKTGQDHKALASARAHGWKVTELSPWMTFHRTDRPTVHIGILPWLRPGNFAFFDPDPRVMVDRLYRFHRLATVPYHGSNAGLPALTIMRDHHNGRIPMWKPRNWDRVAPAHQPTEVAPDWRSFTEHGMPFEHCYDARRQFVSTAVHIVLPLGELVELSGVKASGSPRPGYYLVTTPPWAYNAVLPHPIGNNPEPFADRWITAGTLALLYELADRWDVLEKPQVKHAWVAGLDKTGSVHAGRALRGWAEKVGHAIDGAEKSGDELMIKATKDLYKSGIGMLERPAARVCRYDWAHSIIGLARANQWRKIWKTFQQDGRAPVLVEHDQVWYASTELDPHAEWPAGFPDSDRRESGGYRCKATRNRSTETAEIERN